ncbi:hypothetical protein [Pseudomonas sp. MGal98]|uniref:hypothetical protein n=1 Tax=Pseudomonas sp. MGal98 TaxID=3162460 RepID=UPI0032EBD699
MSKWKMPERMVTASIWAVWVFLALGALGLGMQVVVAAVGMDDAPAWVQALGSVGAILVAIWVSNAQARRDAKSQDKRDWKYLSRACETGAAAVLGAKAITTLFERTTPNAEDLEPLFAEVMQSFDDIEKFSFAELADAKFANVLMAHRRRLRFFIYLARHAADEKKAGGGDGYWMGEVNECYSELENARDEMIERLNAFGRKVNESHVPYRKREE